MNSTLLFDYSRQLKLGCAIILVCVLGFFLWAGVAPIASASLSQGRVVAETKVKTVEHFEGGIIASLLVSEGDYIHKGDVLLHLAKDQAEARLKQLKTREIAEAIRLARLEAEQTFAKDIVMPEWLLQVAKDDSYTKVQIQQQRQLFVQRKLSLQSQFDIYQQQKQQLKRKVVGLQQEREELQRSLDIVSEQLGIYAGLVESGNLPKIQQMELERRHSQIKASFHQRDSQLAVTKQQLLEVDLKVEQDKKSFLNDVHEQLDAIRQSLSESREALTAASDVLTRVQIVSPVDGYVVSLHEGTLGGVVKSGEPILDILPKEDLLIVEALASSEDINVLRLGQKAKVRLTAYNFRELSPVDAKLEYISADIVDDEKREISGYRIKLKLDEEQLPDFVDVYPGMSAEVMVLTGSRTLLQYLADPLFEMFYKSFRES